MRINNQIQIPESEISEVFIRSGGPGGQNINKVATAVQLKINIDSCLSIPDHVKMRIKRLAGKRLSTDGILRIEANRFRTQERNREDARLRLMELFHKALVAPKKRIRTHPSYSARQERINHKKKRGQTKAFRKKVTPENDI